jgi:hypothetical protein
MDAAWERRSGETPKAFAAFCAYRDTLPKDRSIAKCAAAYYGDTASVSKVNQWKRWSARYDWQARVKAWDDEQDRIALEKRLAEIEAMNARHAQEARALQQKAIERLQKLKPDDLTPGLLLRYLVDAARLERSAMGEPDQIVEQRVKRPAEDLTDDELAAIATGSG